MPGDSGSILTSKPGFGVAQRTSTPDAENEIAAVPPVNAKVWVEDAGLGAVGCDEGAVAGADWGVEPVVDVLAVCDVDELFEGVVAPGVKRVDEGTWLPVVDTSPWLSVVDDPRSASDVVVLELLGGVSSPDSALSLGEAKSAADGGSTTWLSTTETPAHATPTAPTLATSHIENSISFFIASVSPKASLLKVNATLNEP